MRVIYYTGSKPAGPIVVPGLEPTIGTVSLPQAEVEGTDFSLPLGRIITVASNGIMGDGNSSDFTSLQDALDNANQGDQIRLKNGDQWMGRIDLPAKPGAGWIYVLPENLGFLPDPGVRVRPGSYGETSNVDESLMPEIVAPQVGVSGMDRALEATTGAHHYRFVGIQFSIEEGVSTGNRIIDWGVTHALADQEHHLILDRCYVKGYEGAQMRQGVVLGGPHMAVIDSEVSDIVHTGADCQCIFSYRGPGPYLIHNNKLVASTENIMFGGADPPSYEHIPRDTIITKNWFYKPPAWEVSDSWLVKNLLEFKIGIRILVQGNIFENMWKDGQTFALNFKSTNQGGGSGAFSITKDLTFRHNWVKNVSDLFNISGNLEGATDPSTRIAVYNNVGEKIGPDSPFGGNGRGLQSGGSEGPSDFFFEHNTIFPKHTISNPEAIAAGGSLDNNIFGKPTDWGIKGSGQGRGSGTLNHYWPDKVVEGNILCGESSGLYSDHPNNKFPGSTAAIDFVDFAAGNYRLAESSPYKGQGTDGNDPGADIDRVEAEIAGVGGA